MCQESEKKSHLLLLPVHLAHWKWSGHAHCKHNHILCEENVHALYTEYDSMLFQTPSIIRFHLSVLAEGSILALQISAN